MYAGEYKCNAKYEDALPPPSKGRGFCDVLPMIEKNRQSCGTCIYTETKRDTYHISIRCPLDDQLNAYAQINGKRVPIEFVTELTGCKQHKTRW